MCKLSAAPRPCAARERAASERISHMVATIDGTCVVQESAASPRFAPRAKSLPETLRCALCGVYVPQCCGSACVGVSGVAIVSRRLCMCRRCAVFLCMSALLSMRCAAAFVRQCGDTHTHTPVGSRVSRRHAGARLTVVVYCVVCVWAPGHLAAVTIPGALGGPSCC